MRIVIREAAYGIGSRRSVDGQLEIPVSTVERCNMIRVSKVLAAVMSSSLVLTAFAFEPSLAQAPVAPLVVLTGGRVSDRPGRATPPPPPPATHTPPPPR